MKRWLLLALVAGAAGLAAAGFARSAGSPNAQLTHEDRLYGGGGTNKDCFVPDIGFCRLANVDFAVDAHADDGDHAAYGNLEASGAPQRSITCLRVDGGNAVVGGFTPTSPTPSLWLQYFVDGRPAGEDLVSPLYVNPDDPADWPAGFPYVCPSAVDGVTSLGLFRSFIHVVRGNVVVQDAG
jgi:hypothetical protein